MAQHYMVDEKLTCWCERQSDTLNQPYIDIDLYLDDPKSPWLSPDIYVNKIGPIFKTLTNLFPPIANRIFKPLVCVDCPKSAEQKNGHGNLDAILELFGNM